MMRALLGDAASSFGEVARLSRCAREEHFSFISRRFDYYRVVGVASSHVVD